MIEGNDKYDYSLPGQTTDPQQLSQVQQFLDLSPDVICSIDAEVRFIHVSAAACQVWGYAPQELTGVALLDLIVPEDRERMQLQLKNLMTEASVSHFQNRCIRKDGSAVPIVWSARWDQQSQTLYCVARKASEKEEGERKALHYEQQLFRAYKLGRIGWWEWDAAKNTINVSDELYEIYGLDKKEHPVLTTELYMSLVHPDDLQKVHAAVSQNQIKAQHQYEHRMIKPSGEVIYVLHHVESVKDKQGTLLHMHGVTKDITDTKQAEMTLRQSEQKLITILESIGDCFFALDKNWVVTYWNRKAEELLHRKREDIVGKNIWEEYNDPITLRFYARYQKAIDEKKAVHFEEYYPTADMWVGISAYPSAEGLAVYFKDITEQKKDQEALEIGNQRYELASKATSDVIWDMDLQTKTVYWGEGFRKLFGHALKNEISATEIWSELIHPDDVFRVNESLQQVINSNNNYWTAEYRFLRADGSYAYILDKGFLIRNKDGIAFRMVGAMQDITRQKESETALKLSEERFRLLFYQSPTPKWMFNGESLQIVEVNEAALRLFGYSKEEFLQLSLHDLIFDDDRHELESITDEKLSRYKDIILQQKKNGEVFSLEITTHPINLPTGRHYIVIGDDVTEKIALQQMVLEEKYAAQQEVAKAIINTQENERSEIAKELHDNVNQLLTTAKLYIENINYFPEQKDAFAQKGIALLQKSIDEIRSISKQLITPVINDIGFKATLDELLNHYSSMNLFQIDLHYKVEEEHLEKSLQLTIYRIIQEQLNNIVKYAKASIVHIGVKANMHSLEVIISDNGIGFDKRITTKGLGLKNMKNRAEFYKGDFRIRSAKGSGTVVQVTFPFHPEEGK
ncbi:MAG TPA: PAS domain S-box protein [Flavisolibacter sp.]|jgi:PAS domain S-box-containing protein|nr:PAS domain S-box protein [Flavisolibacter sp.]